MKPLLIAYSTREGQTRRIAEHLDAYLQDKGFLTVVSDLSALVQLIEFEPTDYEGVLVAASVHDRRHDQDAVKFVTRHVQTLSQMPSCFLSVCSAQILAESNGSSSFVRHLGAEAAEKLVDRFLLATGWHPTLSYPVAGALAYTKYSRLVRFSFQLFAYLGGLSTDAARDHAYTDFVGLERHADAWLRFVDARTQRAEPAA